MAITEHVPAPVAAPRPPLSPQLLITAPSCPASVVEAYHTLFTNIDLALGPNAGRMVAVAAIDSSAHAAQVAANLALVAAQSGDRTLLVDADVQAPCLTDLFGINATPGLAQLLDGEHSDLRALAQSTTLPLLGIISAGTNGGRHNRLDRLGDLPATLLRLKNAADRVMLATAPVLDSPDATRLGAYLDGIVLVITPGQTRRDEAARARVLLEKANVPLLGVTLTPR